MTRKRYVPPELAGMQVAPGMWPMRGWNSPTPRGVAPRTAKRIESTTGEALQRFIIKPKVKP